MDWVGLALRPVLETSARVRSHRAFLCLNEGRASPAVEPCRLRQCCYCTIQFHYEAISISVSSCTQQPTAVRSHPSPRIALPSSRPRPTQPPSAALPHPPGRPSASRRQRRRRDSEPSTGMADGPVERRDGMACTIGGTREQPPVFGKCRSDLGESAATSEPEVSPTGLAWMPASHVTWPLPPTACRCLPRCDKCRPPHSRYRPPAP